MYTLLVPISDLQNCPLPRSKTATWPTFGCSPPWKSGKVNEIFDINFNIQVHWWWACCRFTCFICGKILEQAVKVTKIRQHLDYAPTSARKPIIPILTASNLLQKYEWFVRNLVHCLGWYHVVTPGPCFFLYSKCLRCTQLPRKKTARANAICDSTVSPEVFPESKVFSWDLVGIARAGVAAEFSGLYNPKKVPKSRYETNVLLFFRKWMYLVSGKMINLHSHLGWHHLEILLFSFTSCIQGNQPLIENLRSAWSAWIRIPVTTRMITF